MARKKRKRNASRGSVNNIILRTLSNGDKYGYEIIKEVEEYSNGKIQKMNLIKLLEHIL